MTWREKTIVRILLLVARLICDDPRLSEDIRHLANHIDLHAPKEEQDG
jgi:hypothetical protein